MNYLSAENLTKSFGEKILFANVNFGISKGQKVALVARNGAGKTTLLNLIMGLDSPDSGEINTRKEIRIGYLEQNPVFPPKTTVLETLFLTQQPEALAVRAYEAALETGIQSTIDAAAEQVESLKAWDYENRITQILFRLAIKGLNRQVHELSGGQKKRIALAALLIAEPDFLILDEPTNHLDVEMIEWLESYLSKQHLTILLVTHDRYFLDRVCTEIIEIDQQKIYRYGGNYEYFLEKKAERAFNEKSEIEKARNIYRTELEWMRRQPKARGTKAKAREDSFYQLEDKVKSQRIEEKFELSVKMPRIGGKILEIKKLTKSYDEQILFKNFSYTFKPKDRIGIVGRNGAGKTTLLKILVGEESYQNGKIEWGESIQYGYYRQDGLPNKPEQRVIDVVKEIAEVIPLNNGEKISAAQFLFHFQFDYNLQHTPIEKLSGGERRRLHLITVLIKNPNFLILDEPTNDLDLITLNLLEEFLLHYEGCLLIVSHDRYFMDKLVEHLFILEDNGNIRDYNGTYRDYYTAREAELRAEKEKLANVSKANNAQTIPEKKRKLSYNEQREYTRLETEIAELEAKKEMLTNKMSESNISHAQMQAYANEVTQIIDLLDQKTNRWLELSEFAE